jgi:hypothetical protein
MKNPFYCCLLLLFSLSVFKSGYAKPAGPEPVTAGIYITSIHNIDFKQKEYTLDFWLWLKYKNRSFDFVQNLEIPQAKTISKSFSTIDSADGFYSLLMKVQCVMKDSWKIGNFPFDRQNLRLSIENSQYDARFLYFVVDTAGKHYDEKFALNGWNIDSFTVNTGKRVYETGFGDTSLARPHSEYSTFKAKIGIKRDALGLFWKLFLGMYAAFLIAYVCFYIHADGIDSRFGLSVGALFAVIGNKYIVDSSLPESSSFTLVDTLHGLTLFFIFGVITCNAYALKLIKKDRIKAANRFDRICAVVALALYAILNIYFISNANS